MPARGVILVLKLVTRVMQVCDYSGDLSPLVLQVFRLAFCDRRVVGRILSGSRLIQAVSEYVSRFSAGGLVLNTCAMRYFSVAGPEV